MRETTAGKTGLGNRVVLFAFIAAGIAAAFFAAVNRDRFQFSSAKPEQTAVFGGWTYDQEDQRKAAAALVKAGLTDYEWNEDRLLVPAARRGEYERVLGENQAIPQKPSALKQEALDGISSFESESRTKLRDLYSSARQLEKTLESFDQIESASVGPHSRREDAGFRQKTVVTATITVKPKGNRPLTPELVSSITMAARHLLGITNNDDVSVIDTVSGRAWLGSEGAVSRLNGISYSQEKARLEDLWTAKFESLFSYIPGIRIAAAVELSPVENSGSTAETANAEESNTAGPAALSERRKAGLLFYDEEAFSAENISELEKTQLYQPKSIAVSITVPESYFRQITGSSEDAAFTADQEKEKILNGIRERAAALLTPADSDVSLFPSRVDVSCYTDFPADAERVLYPQPEEPIQISESVPEKQLESTAEEVTQNDAAAQIKRFLSDKRAGYFFAVLAFAAGIGVRSLFRSRRAAEPEKIEKKRTSEEAEKNGTDSGISCSADSGKIPVQAETPLSMTLPKGKKSEPRPELSQRESESAVYRDRDEELKQLFDDLDAEDELEDDFDPDEEEADSGISEPHRPIRNFTAAGKDGFSKDYRIEKGAKETAGPHYPASDSDDDEEEEFVPGGADSRFSYVFNQGKLRFPEEKIEPCRFQFLESLSPEELHGLIAKQRPQTIALIARTASENLCNQVLEHLGNRLRTEVERRMKVSEAPDAKIADAVETALRNELGITV